MWVFFSNVHASTWWSIYLGCNVAHLTQFDYKPKKSFVLCIFSPMKKTKYLLFVMALWVLNLIFIIWNVIYYWNVCWCVFLNKYEHFMHNVFLVMYNYLFYFIIPHAFIRIKNSYNFMVSKFNANINFKSNLGSLKYVGIKHFE